MAEFLHPGVYVNEVKSGNAPIEAAGTSTAAFIGYTKRGELGKAVYVTSFTDFVNKFAYGLESPFMADANLAYSVYGFFQNGGTKAYIVRVADENAKKATVKFTDGAPTPADVLIVNAIDEGAFGNDISVKLVNGAEAGSYDLSVSYKGVLQAVYTNVSVNPEDDNFIEYAVNGADKFITVQGVGGTIAVADVNVSKPLTTGNDGLSSVSDAHLISGLDALKSVRTNIIVIPESQSAAVNQAGLAFAEQNLAFYVADGLKDATVETIQTERDSYNSEYGALYFPWIKVSDPIAKGVDKTRFVPVGGYVAGVIARIDGLRGVHKAPAGLEAVVQGALATKVTITDQEQDLLNPKGINVIRGFSGAGIVVWGARTVSTNPAVKYVNVRRALLFIRESIKNGTAWAVFEPNNESLWAKLNTSAKSFLKTQFGQGMFKGTLDQAFFVKCDAEINTQEEIDAGRVNVHVGVAINKPGEFIVVNISQKAGE